jgi:uncharacterized protein
MVYIDSSALVKRYAPLEINASQITALFTTPLGIYTSNLTPIEMISAFRNKERSKDFSKAMVSAAINDFEAHSPKDYKLVQAVPSTYIEAKRMLLTYKLRAYDAMHVATALTIVRAANIPPVQLEFYTGDKEQAVAAQAEGFTVILV